MTAIFWYVDISRLIDDEQDLQDNAMWYIKHYPETRWTYEDIEAAGFECIEAEEGCLLDSGIYADESGNVVIFAERAVNGWCSTLVPIRKSTNAETWDYWYENFVHDEIEED